MREAQQRVQDGTRELAILSEHAFEAWMRNSNQLMRQMMEMNVELATWGREQLDDSIDAVRSVAQSRSIEDTFGIQARLMRTSLESSVRHAGNVFNLATRAMLPAMQIAQRAAAPSERQSHRQQGR